MGLSGLPLLTRCPYSRHNTMVAATFAHSLSTSQLVSKSNGVNYRIPLEELRRKLVWCPYNNITIRNVPLPELTQYYHIKSYVDAESAAEI